MDLRNYGENYIGLTRRLLWVLDTPKRVLSNLGNYMRVHYEDYDYEDVEDLETCFQGSISCKLL